MIGVLRKTTGRTSRFFGQALGLRESEREHAVVVWALVAGAIWLAVGLRADPGWLAMALAGLFLFSVLAAVCAIDARYGIIPNSLVGALAVGGLAVSLQDGLPGLWERTIAAVVVLIAAWLFRSLYRRIRGFDGLGLGDVKFVAAGTLWIGLAGVPALLLAAVVSALISLLILRAEGHALDGQQAISFGPHLAVGLWLVWVIGPLPFGV